MAVFHPHIVKCVCGNTLTVQLADSINVVRSPESRQRILQGELHRAACAVCSRQMTVEKPFYDTDLARNIMYKVCPRGERHMWKEVSKELDTASGFVPSTVSDANGRTLRVIFGMDELREKLIAQDAALDDRVLELLKVLLVHEHPILLRRPRLRLVLDKVTEADLEFTARYEHEHKPFRLQIPRRVADELAGDPDRLLDWTRQAHSDSLFQLPDHWVNMWRWSPQPRALDQLRKYAIDVKAGREIDTTSASFQRMLGGIPRGSHLPTWAKQDLDTLFQYAKGANLQQLEDRLFEIRFGVELEDDWSLNDDTKDIDTLWKLLKDLPDSNVEGNTKIHEILLDSGRGGGMYSPTSHDISIGSDELTNRERFEDVVRHEVGHAVHEMNESRVNDWLKSQFGWHTFGGSDAEIDEWIGMMGGWGNLTVTEQKEVRDALRLALGNGSSWTPGPTPSLASGHPWYRADFGPRLTFEKTGPYWYQNHATWYRSGGKAFFLNYWYRTLIALEATTLDLVAQMPDAYASMSHYEFFAELYALYYDLDDPLHHIIPTDVAEWFDSIIGAPAIDAPMPAAPGAKREWETIDRPYGSKANE